MCTENTKIKTLVFYNIPLPELNKKVNAILKALRQWDVYQITMTIEHEKKSMGYDVLVFLPEKRLKAIEIAQLYKAIGKTGKPLTFIQVVEDMKNSHSDKTNSNTKNKSSN